MALALVLVTDRCLHTGGVFKSSERKQGNSRKVLGTDFAYDEDCMGMYCKISTAVVVERV